MAKADTEDNPLVAKPSPPSPGVGPSCVQVPVHAAILFTKMPPAVSKVPPTYSVPPIRDMLSTEGVPKFEVRTPPPMADHALPFHCAIPLTGMSPAVVNQLPPAYTTLPLASKKSGLLF